MARNRMAKWEYANGGGARGLSIFAMAERQSPVRIGEAERHDWDSLDWDDYYTMYGNTDREGEANSAEATRDRSPTFA